MSSKQKQRCTISGHSASRSWTREKPRRNQLKPYTKPEIRKVTLRPEEAVLGSCKTDSTGGPIQPNCSFPMPCSNNGS